MVRYTAGVLTISDSRSKGEAEDLSGPAAVEILKGLGIRTVERLTVPDDEERIAGAVRHLVGQVRLIVTTGGTGIALRDVTPEALKPLFDRPLPGFGEIMRTRGYARTPLAIISRSGAGIVGRTLVVMLPGSPGAVRDGLSVLGPAMTHVLGFLAGRPADCQSDTGAAP